MWIFLNSAFISLVEHRDNPDMLLVRARVDGDIEAIFPSANVFELADADYRYRAEVARIEVAEVLAQQVRDIDYYNFKNSVPDDLHHHAYLRVWQVMRSMQSLY